MTFLAEYMHERHIMIHTICTLNGVYVAQSACSAEGPVCVFLFKHVFIDKPVGERADKDGVFHGKFF